MDLHGIRHQLEQVARTGNFALQTQSVSLLVNEVRKYVDEIKKEKALLSEKYVLQKLARKRATTPEEEEEVREAKATLEVISRIELNIYNKLRALRALEQEVKSLVSEIQQAYK